MKREIAFLTLRVLWGTGLVLTALALIATPFLLGASFKNSDPPLGVYSLLIGSVAIYCCAIPYIIGLFAGLRVINLLLPEKTDISNLVLNLKVLSYCSYSFSLIFLMGQVVFYSVYDFYMYAITVLPTLIIVLSGVTLGVFFNVVAMKLVENKGSTLGVNYRPFKRFLFEFMGGLMILILVILVMTMEF